MTKEQRIQKVIEDTESAIAKIKQDESLNCLAKVLHVEAQGRIAMMQIHQIATSINMSKFESGGNSTTS